MRPIDAVLGKVDGLQGTGPRYRAICPAHASKNKTRTLAIFDADNERVLLHCFAGCDVESIVQSIGLQLEDLFPPRITDSQPRIKKPWRAADVAKALESECAVAWIVLTDLANGKVVSKTDRKRAGEAAQRCAHLLQELTHAA